MRKLACFIILCGVFGWSSIQAAPAAADSSDSSCQLTIELRDGSRVVGKTMDDAVSLHSGALGDLKLSWAGIRAIEFAADTDAARLTATNGDGFSVQFAADTLSLETGFGKTDLPVKQIRSLKVLPKIKSKVQVPAVATGEAGFQLTIDLRDGSHVVGKGLDESVSFDSTTMGDLKLGWAGIRSIEYASANTDTARLTATNGDVYEVRFAADTLRVETSFGKTELPVKLIRSLKVSAMTGPGQLPAGLVALWSGEGDGSDSVGGNNMAPTDISFVEGKVGQAFGFNGVNQFVNCGNQKAGNFGTDDFTVTFWVKFNTLENIQVMVKKYVEGLNGPEATSGWTIVKLLNNRFQFHNATSRVDFGTAVADTWTYMAVTRENGIVRCYVNGVLSGQLATPADLDSTASLKLGHRGNPTDTPGSTDTRQFYLNGALDEIAFYNRALSASEIQAICTEQNNGEPLPPPAPAPNANPFYNGFDQNGLRSQLSRPSSPLP